MDIDYTLRTDEPELLLTKVQLKIKLIMISGRSNTMCLIVMKHSISETIKGDMPDKINIKSFLTEIANRFSKSHKVEASTHLSKLVNMRYNDKENIREYIMRMSNLISKVKELKLKLSEEILVQFILISLPVQFNLSRSKKKGSLIEFISHCVQKEKILKYEKTESSHIVSQGTVLTRKETEMQLKEGIQIQSRLQLLI